jgi:hypothetical protein
MYMEISQGNSLCSYFKQAKMSFFSSSTKLENRRAEKVLVVGYGTKGMGGGGGRERV